MTNTQIDRAIEKLDMYKGLPISAVHYDILIELREILLAMKEPEVKHKHTDKCEKAYNEGWEDCKRHYNFNELNIQIGRKVAEEWLKETEDEKGKYCFASDYILGSEIRKAMGKPIKCECDNTPYEGEPHEEHCPLAQAT